MDGIGHAAGPAAAGLLLGMLGAPAVMIGAGALFLFVAYVAVTSRLGEMPAVEPVHAVSAGPSAVAAAAQPDSIAGGPS